MAQNGGHEIMTLGQRPASQWAGINLCGRAYAKTQTLMLDLAWDSGVGVLTFLRWGGGA